MKTTTLLNRIKKGYGISWHQVAEKLDITYPYVCYLRREKKEAGKKLLKRIMELYQKTI